MSDTHIGDIFKFDAAGNRTVFASGLNNPAGLAVDKAGNLYVADGNTIDKYDPSGAMTVFSSGNYLNQPRDLAFDNNGFLYVANANTNTIIKIDSVGNQSIFVGQGSPLNVPFGLAFDRSGNLYVSSTNGNSIYKIDPFGNATLFTNTALAGPTGVSFDATGNLFVVNVQGRTIEKFDPSGQGTVFVDNTGGDPYGAAFDSAGNLYVALYTTNTIEKYDSIGQGSVFGNGSGGPLAVAIVPSIQSVIERFETESLTVSRVYAASHSIINDAKLSGGKGTQLNAMGTGQYVTYTVPVSDTGTYKVRVGVKTGPNLGIFKLSIGGVRQGKAQDEYTPTIGYGVRDLGIVTFFSGGNKAFKFLVSGKNAKSGGYGLALDYIELVPTNRLETESLKVQSITPKPSGYSSAQWYGVFNATAASGGAGTYFNANALGNYITYTLPVAKPGTYHVRVGIQTKPNKGIFQLAINGLDVGQSQDEFDPSITYGVRDLGTASFATSGNYPFKFAVTGKNPSSAGYILAFDFIELIP